MSAADDRTSPIGLFDAGVGRLSILREVAALRPCERLPYLMDQAHCPYGNRSIQAIRRLGASIVRFLLAHGVKCILAACNTAPAAELAHLRQPFPDTPFVGMVPPVKPAPPFGIVGI